MLQVREISETIDTILQDSEDLQLFAKLQGKVNVIKESCALPLKIHAPAPRVFPFLSKLKHKIKCCGPIVSWLLAAGKLVLWYSVLLKRLQDGDRRPTRQL